MSIPGTICARRFTVICGVSQLVLLAEGVALTPCLVII
jgi:hypothetical protein